MKYLSRIFLSVESMTFMLIIFAVAIGAATFIENDYGTESAKVLVYNATWFEILLALLGINLLYNVYSYKMWKRGKRLSLLFHLSFIIIVLGAATTRYAGFEGMMHIREGGMSNSIESSEAFLQIKASSGGATAEKRKEILLSPLVKPSLHERVEVNGSVVDVRFRDFIVNAGQRIVEVENGKPLLQMMISENGNPRNIIMQQGDELVLSRFLLAFDDGENGPFPAVRIKQKENGFVFVSNVDVTVTSMADQSQETLAGGQEHPFEATTLYSVEGTFFVLRDFTMSGELQAVPMQMEGGMGSGKRTTNALVVDVTVGNETKTANLFGGRGIPGEAVPLHFGDVDVELAYGAIVIELPFALELVDFQIDRYPGSNSPSSYASEVILRDEQKGLNEPFRVYMNHILQHRGFRFFQSSYDQDERGTILSVSYDPGTPVTYIGYLLLGIGLFVNFLNPQSRFRVLSRLVKKVQEQKAALTALLLFFVLAPVALQAQHSHPIDNTAVFKINAEHADKFGKLLVQDSQGRIKPVNTMAHEVLNKVVRKSSLLGLNANQIILGMIAQPAAWQQVDMIRIKHPVLKATLGLEEHEKRASFADFFDPHTHQYKLSNPVEGAKRKRPAEHDKFDKELIKVDERLSICYMVYIGHLTQIFPLQNDPNHTWVSYAGAGNSLFGEEKTAVSDMWTNYINAVNSAITNGNWQAADEALDKIAAYQQQYGAAVLPSSAKIKAEIFLHNADLFGRLSPVYLLTGLVLLIIGYIKVFRVRSNFKRTVMILSGILVAGFVVHTLGLALRWYVSGHAPWSNGYESMIYIAWATVLAGVIFAKREPMPLAATSVLAGLILFVAHLSWMDPQITNLVPVLKSYWLMIHVSMITASYGFLGLGAILAFITLLLFVFKTAKNARRVELSIKELTMMNEQTLIIGLVLITIGNFLGAVWANESWGRYWGWDPKETWALVTILIYSAVIHFRLIPKLKSFYAFNVGALLAFFSVIMTYFGVNYYLSGLHSYAQGDPVPIPTFVYYTVATVFLVIILAYRSRKMGAME